MKYRYLGKSGLVVSELSLGTMTFGADNWGCDKAEAEKIFRSYIEAGGNMIDVANVYAGGKAESFIGDFLSGTKRDDLLLASKCNFPFGSSVNNIGSTRKHIINSCEQSLKRLKTDYIDFYYLHRPDPTAPVEEIAETMDILVKQGKILYPAFSNLPAWRLALLNAESRRRGTTEYICGQYMYNLADRNCEQEIIPAMVHEGIGFLCWSPLAGGLLTGKYTGDEIPKDSRFDHRRNLDVQRFWNDHGFSIAKQVMKVAEKLSISPASVAIAWLLSKPYASSVILGVRTHEQLMNNLGASDVELPEEVIRELDEVSEPERCYLWRFNEQTNDQYRQRARQFPGTVIV